MKTKPTPSTPKHRRVALCPPKYGGCWVTGPSTYLNNMAHWRNIPINVWEYTIGGYQVVKKWLSYREDKILWPGLETGRSPRSDEHCPRIAAIILLQPKLDENYNQVKTAAFDWPAG